MNFTEFSRFSGIVDVGDGMDQEVAGTSKKVPKPDQKRPKTDESAQNRRIGCFFGRK